MKTDLAWLAGIIDGEGSFELGKQPSGYGYFSALIIYNTDMVMIEKVEAIIENLGCVSSRRIKPRDKLGLGQLLVQGVQIVGDLPALIEAVLPYMASKKREFAADILTLSKMRQRGSRWTVEQIAFAKGIRSTHMPLSGRSRWGTRAAS